MTGLTPSLKYLAPLSMNISEVTAHSVALMWSQSSGNQEGLNGFLVRLYQRNESAIHQFPIFNCTTTIEEANACRLGNLQPSTNYSATVTAIRRLPRDDEVILGDESVPINFTTSKLTYLKKTFNWNLVLFKLLVLSRIQISASFKRYFIIMMVTSNPSYLDG